MRSFDDILKDRERKKQGQSYGGDFDRVLANRALGKINSLYNSWAKDTDSFVTDYNSRYFDEEGNYVQKYHTDHSDWSIGKHEQMSSLNSQRKEIESLLEKYGSYYDKDYVSKLKGALNSGRVSTFKIGSSLRDQDDFYSTYTTEDDYNSAVASQKEYEEMSTLDLDALDSEIKFNEGMLNLINEYRELSNNASSSAPYYDGEHGKADAMSRMYAIERQFELYGITLDDEKSIKEKLSAAQQKYNTAERMQNGIKLANDALSAKDFAEKSGYVSTKKDDAWSRLTGTEYDDTYEYINDVDGMRSEMERKRDAYQSDNPWDDGVSTWEEKGYDLLTDEEVSIYNYYYSTGGKEKAEEYLDSIQETLYNRRAHGMYANLEDKPLLEIAFSIEAGLDQFASGVQNIFNTDDYIPTNATQQASGMVREDLADNSFNIWYNFKTGEWEDKVFGSSAGQMLYDLGSTTANMAPSLITGAAVNAVLPGSGGYVTNALMGLSSGGNAYKDALNQGYTEEQARTYGTMVGTSEALLGKLLGSIGNAGNSLTGKTISKLVSGLDDGFAKFALEFGESIASESIEEGLQEALTPLFENIAFNAGNGWDDIDWSQVGYSALLGGLSAFGLEGPGAVVNSIAAQNDAFTEEGNRVMNAGGVDALVSLANEISGVKNLSSRVSKVNGKNGVNAKAVGKLSKAVNDVRITQNKADIVKALEEKGVSSAKAKNYANILFAMNEEYFAGTESTFTLGTDAQWKKITGDPNVYSVLSSIITDENSSVNKRNSQHALGRMGIKVNEDGTADLSDVIAKEVLKENYSKQSEGVKAEVADDGKTKVISTDTEVTLKGIDHIETVKVDGKTEKVGYVKVADAEGNESVVNIRDVKFASRNEAILYDTFVGMDIDPAYFDDFVKNFNEADFDGSIGEAAMQYATGFVNAFRYGWANLDTELGENVYASKLTKSVRNTAYKLGKESVSKETEAKQSAKDTAVAERKASGKGKARTQGKLNMDAVKTKKRTAMQNAGVGLAKRLTALGIDVYIYESKQNANGEWVDDRGELADNGFYRSSDGSIHIDLNAGRSGQGIMVYTLSHELVHFMRDQSPKEFKAFADLLVKWYGKKGVSVSDLINQRMVEENLSWDEACEEVIARSCESFLTDSNIADRIIELQKTDKNAWEIIRDKVLKFLDWMKSLFKDVDLESEEGQFFRELQGEIDELYDAFYNTLASASETFQWAVSIAEAKSTAETLATAGVTVDADTGSAVMNSVRYAPKTQAEIDKVANALSETMGVSIEKAKAWVKSETSLTSIILDPSNEMFLDYEADDRYEAIKKNAEYPQGTVDFSNLCKKRREFTALLDKLQKEHPNRIITAAEMEKIRQILIEEDVTVACGLCYVEERRQKLGEIAQGFIDGYKNGTLKESIAKELDAKDGYVPTIYDLITYDGYRALTTEHPSIAKAFQKFNNARGMQAGRLIEGIAEYKRDILKWSQKKVDFVNSVGGLRVFSFSDFEATHLIDLVQVIQDCAAKGVMIQAYTKVPAFANAVKDTNMKVNRSLIAKGTGIKYENGRMVLDLDPVEGIDINDKDFFDSTNSKNVGNILVGMSSEQIRLAMKSSFVDYIIPFHTSLPKEILKAKKIDHWDNYKNFQTDKEYHPENVTYNKDGSVKSDGWVVAENQINVYVDVIQAAEAEGKPIKNKVDFVNKFLAVAKEKGLKPRFWNFLDVDANGEYTYTEGYHKFLVDFKLFDQQGNILPQEPVVPEFDDALNARILHEYVEGKKTPAPRDAVYDRLVSEVINGDVKKSSRNTGHSEEKLYNEKNTTKEGLIRGESRQETRDAFLRRAVQTVLQVGTRGETAYGYRRTSPTDVTERSRQVEEELKKLGVPSIVYDVLEENKGGVTSVVTSESTTIRGDAVYINNSLILDPKTAAGHEAYHFWKPHYERTVYNGVLEDNIIFSSNAFDSFISDIADGYSLDDEIGSRQWETLMEEVRAYISGCVHSGIGLDRVMPFILDFSEVEAAWNALVNSRSQDVDNLNHTKDQDIRHSLRSVPPVQPTSSKWERTLTTAEVKERFPELWDVSADESEVRNPTQISGTVKSYRKVYDYLRSEGFDGTILDASSGLGYGTKAGIDEYGFDVEDIEPYPDKSYHPKYIDYSTLDKKYDVIISNAVLNVLPQDQRDALVVKMGEMLNDGGRIFINVRGDDVRNASSKEAINDDLMEYYIAKSGSYQKGFTKSELVAYLEDALGDGFSVAHISFFGKTAAVVTKESKDIRYSRRVSAEQDAKYLELAKDPVKNEQALRDMLDEAAKKAFPNSILIQEGTFHKMWHHTNASFNSFLPGNSASSGRLRGIYFTPQEHSTMSRLGSIHKQYYLNVENVKFAFGIKADKVFVDQLREMQEGVTDRNEIAEINRRFKEETGVDAFFDWQNGWYNIMTPEQIKSADLVTYDDNGNVIPLSERFDSSDDDVRYSRRGSSLTARSLLANALDGAAQNEIEARRLSEYKAKIDLINAEEQKLYETRKRIAELSFAKGAKDTVAIKNLQDTATRIANRIDTYDKELLKLEAMRPIKDIVDRERDAARKLEKQRSKEAIAEYREQSAKAIREVMNRNTEVRKKNVESRKRTAVRNQIKRVVKDLNGMLNRGTKERNVKTDMQETVGSALKLANVIFNDDITNEDIVLMGSTMATEEEQKLLAQYKGLIEKRDSSTYDEAMKAINKISTLDRKLSDLFKRERARLNQSLVSDAVNELAKAYASLKSSDKDYVNFAYNEEVHKRLLSLSDTLGGTIVKDMSLAQLEELYDAYKMIRHMVRESNSLFRMGKTQDLAKTVTSVQNQILAYYKERKNDPGAGAKKIGDILKSFAWNEMKPVAAFETLGAEAYTELFWDAIKAEGEWAKWMEESKSFLDAQRTKYGYKSWDMESAHDFTLPDGKVFRLTLQDMMSIYAYSKRDQAQEHMTVGGFQFDKNNAYKDTKGKTRVRLGDLYVTDWTTITRIIAELEKMHDGKVAKYVDAVQKYLTDMGKRGNEVSEILYGIGIFNESAYFPLMSAKDYRSSVEEALNNTQTQVSLKNTGMTKQTVPHASNPIILQGFDDVVIGHIDKMAKYCTQVLAIENLRRVFDSVSADDRGGYISTKAVIEKVFGESAKKYFDQYITDLNGGVFVDGAESPTMAMFSKFKGTAVGASLSVIVQQPMAVIRAMDVINPKHFILGKASETETKRLYGEIEKYAPVAIIKKMGGFDVGSSRTARDYLGLRTDKGVKRVVDTINDVSMWGAGKADELGWNIIWLAVKREIASSGKFKQGSAEYYKACGERFTEVIVRTQVYDSINSRSGYMRSKRELVKFATSFMGEPTTVINQAYLSLLNVSRAKDGHAKKVAVGKLGRTMGVLTVSTVLTTAAKSLVYAMRDDEDDESLRDRWAYNFGNSLKGDIHPLNLIPYGRDIVSLFEGWDVERPDMTLIANVIDSYQKLIKDDETPEEWLTLFGDVSNLFGIPAKNVIRDAKAIFNFFGDIFDDVAANDIGGAFKAGWKGIDYTDKVKAENAFANGDDSEVEDIVNALIEDKVANGKTEKEAKSAVRSSFTSTYKKQYLEACENDDEDEMDRIREFLYATGLYGKLRELDETLNKWRESD